MDTPSPSLHHYQHALLAALLLVCALASAGSAQPETPRQGIIGSSDDYATDQEMRVSTTMIALLAAVIAVFVLIAASIIYLRHCTGYSYGAHAARPSSDRGSVPAAPGMSSFLARRLQRRARGLDAAVVEAFPTMRYAEAKALRVGKKGASLECAVCLSEFEDEERLRLLPLCSHAFHPDCIGEWLASHVTCPVCRCNLDPSKDTGSDDEPASNPPPAPPEANTNSNSNSSEIAVVRHHRVDSVRPPSVVIDVVTEEEEAEQRRKEAMELQRIWTQRRAMRSRPGTPKLVRSHSTGHSPAVVGLDRDLERFTLRLPEHLRREIIAALEQSSRRRGQRAGEGSSSRGGRLGRTGKWPSFLRYTRTLSGRFFSGPRRTDSSDGGEVSSSSSTKIRGKRVAAVDFADGSALGGGGVPGAKAGSVAVDVDKASGRQVRT